jgi:glycosyltransferase involved in cell wall biosynthesis
MISIIIPTYNRAHLISDTLNSVISQSYQNWECLVVDDFSSDNTIAILEEFSSRDNRIKYFLNTMSKGAQGARNTGISKAKGDYICFFDSDDIMYSGHLQKKINLFAEKPELDIITSFSHILNNDSKIKGTFCWITEGDIQADLLSGTSYVDMNSALIRSCIIKNYGFLDEECPSYHEWDLHLSVSKNSNYGFIPEFLTGYYQRGVGTISADRKRDLLGRIYILGKYKNEFIRVNGENKYIKEFQRLYILSKQFELKFTDFYPCSKFDLEVLKKYKKQLWLKKIKNKILNYTGLR